VPHIQDHFAAVREREDHRVPRLIVSMSGGCPPTRARRRAFRGSQPNYYDDDYYTECGIINTVSQHTKS
jgi:hypothetical protein